MQKFIGAIVMIAAILFGLAALLARPMQLLWNSIMPELFGFKAISFWMAFRLSLLSGLLFRSGVSYNGKK